MTSQRGPAGRVATQPAAPSPVRRRERILAAAISAFAQGGFDGTSTRAIADVAGVTEPLLFYHFRSKADLYLAAVKDQLEKLREGLDDALVADHDARSRLHTFVEVYLRYFTELEPGLTVTLRELNGVPREAADAITRIHHETVIGRLEEILAGGVQEGAFRELAVPACAVAITGIVQIFIRSGARTPGRFSHEDAVAQVLDYYAAGLAP
jgi:AcrR family transcriptional regulator